MKPLYTYEVAALAGVSTRTLQRWMKHNKQRLAALGYRPTDKFITPRALEYIAQEYCIQLDDALGNS